MTERLNNYPRNPKVGDAFAADKVEPQVFDIFRYEVCQGDEAIVCDTGTAFDMKAEFDQ